LNNLSIFSPLFDGGKDMKAVSISSKNPNTPVGRFQYYYSFQHVQEYAVHQLIDLLGLFEHAVWIALN